MNGTNINTYFGAKWNVEICTSGVNGIESKYPLGKDLKNNMILDNWIQSLIYLFSPSGGNINQYCDGLSFAAITNGEMHIGSGTGIPKYSQTGLNNAIKKTSFIRPFFNQCTGIYYPESGMAVFSRKYDFDLETGKAIYSEAGFRPFIANALPVGKKNHLWSRFLFTAETGVSGYIYANSGSSITGMDLSGVFAEFQRYDIPKHTSSIYRGFSGIPSFDLGWRYVWPENSGMFLINDSGNTTGFVHSPTNITELVTGFISGYLSGGNFYPFTLSNYPNESSGLSGIYLQDEIIQTIYYPSGGNFSGFNDFTGKYFSPQSGFIYSGFDIGYQTYGSGFRPTNGALTGSMTGIIGSRNILKLDGYITGTVGYKNIPYPITLTTGEFLKLRYDTYIQVPAIVNPVAVTGQDIIHGEFNASGQIKLVGQMQQIFGSIDSDGKITEGYGMWWPVHKTLHKNFNSQQSIDSPYPNSHLSALMIKSGFTTGIWEFNKTFPPINSGIPIISLELDDERQFCSDSLLLGECSGANLYTTYYGLPTGIRQHREKFYYSYLGLSTRPSWPYYAHNTLMVVNYNAPNNATAQWPSGINFHMIFPGAYPNKDTGIGGFIICKADETNAGCGRSITDLAGNVWGPNVYKKPNVYENINAYLDCGIQRQYAAWYYKFDTPQIKYEDQMINLFLTFSLGRIEK
jgi:hypothetical protein